jgi:hypothetical protein
MIMMDDYYDVNWETIREMLGKYFGYRKIAWPKYSAASCWFLLNDKVPAQRAALVQGYCA